MMLHLENCQRCYATNLFYRADAQPQVDESIFNELMSDLSLLEDKNVDKIEPFRH